MTNKSNTIKNDNDSNVINNESDKQLMSQGGFVEEIIDDDNNNAFPESVYLEYADSEEGNDKSD